MPETSFSALVLINSNQPRVVESLMVRYYGWFDEKDVVFRKLGDDVF